MHKGWRPTRMPSELPPGAFSRGKLGAPGGIRTPDPLIRSQMLYPLSYGRTVSSQVHAQIEHLIRCHDSERRPTQYTASI